MKVDTRDPLLRPRPDVTRAATILAVLSFVSGFVLGFSMAQP